MNSVDSLGIRVFDRGDDGLITFGSFPGGSVPTTADKFSAGCILFGNGKVYANSGTSASPSFQNINDITTGEIADSAITTAKLAAAGVTGAKLSAGAGYFQIAANTNATTPVNVFGAGGAPIALTVTSVVTIAKDTTASNIVLKQAANTVATIAKSTTAGLMVGATTLANTVYAAADVCTIESSGAGEARVLITFTVA